MTQLSWNTSKSADWTTAADWTGGVVPGAADDVTIAVAGATVSVSTGQQAANSITTTSSVLSITGGTLAVGSAVNLHGAFAQSGGVMTLAGQGGNFFGAASLTGGALDLLAGTLTAGSGFTVAGGTLSLAGQGATFAGPLTIGSGLITLLNGSLTTQGSVSQTGGTVALASQADFAGTVTLSAGLMELQAGSLLSTSGFTVSGGTLDLAGQAIFDGGLTLSAGAIDLQSGALTANGGFTQSGGSLTLGLQGGTFNGASTLTAGTISSQYLLSTGGFLQTGGQLLLSGTGAVFNANLVQTGGLIRADTGTISLYGGSNSMSGTIAGAGTLLEAGGVLGLNGTTTLGSATVLSIGKVSVTSGVLALVQTGAPYTLSYGGYLSVTSAGTLSLGGNTLTLAGRAQLSGDLTGGTVLADGGGQLNGLVLDNSAMLDVNSAMILTALSNSPGLVTLKADSQITIAAGGSLKLTGNDTINDANNNATITDNGLLARVGGAGAAVIMPSFNQSSTGSIAVGLGTLDFSGANNSFNGSISGAGTFSLGASSNGSLSSDSFGASVSLATGGFVLTGLNTQLSLYNNLSYGGSWDQSGGVFLLGYQGQTLTLNLNGNVVLDGGVIKSSSGTIATTGLVNLSNSPPSPNGIAIEGFTNFIVAGLAEQDAQIQLGAASSSKPTATILHGASWLLEDGASINGAYGMLVNNGTLQKYNGSSAGTIQSDLINNGLITVAASTLVLDGSGSLGGASGLGAISGAGQLALEGSGTYLLSAGMALTVAQVLIDNTPQGPQASVVALATTVSGGKTLTALTYGGVWAQHGGTLQLDSDTLTLKGTTALDGGIIAGPGTLVTAGALTLGGSPNLQLTVNGSAVLDITKSAEQSTDITVGGLATLAVAKGATLTQDDTANILGTGTLSVAGSMVVNGTGFEQIDPSAVVTGAIKLQHGELSFLGGVSGTGSLVVQAGARLDLMGSVASSDTINLSAGGASLLIGDAAAFSGVISGFSSGDFIEISALASGGISTSLDATGKLLTIADSAQHTYTIQFAQAQTASSIVLADGPHGYIGVYHV